MRRALTLVELLVVLGIIAILVALLMSATIACGFQPAVGSERDKAVRSAFLQEYGPHAEALRRYYTNNIRTRFISTDEIPDGTKRVREVKARLNEFSFVLEGAFLQKNSRPGDDADGPIDHIEARNSRYSFMLSPQENGKYLLKQMDLEDSNQSAALCFLTFPVCDYRYSKQNFADMCNNEAIEFVEYSDGVWHNDPAKMLKVRLSFLYGGSPKKRAESFVQFYFSSADGWICRGVQAYAAEKDDVRREELYVYERRPGEPYPVPTRLEFWLRDTHEPTKSTRMGTTDIVDFERNQPFSDLDFTLTAFGLPEPKGVVWDQTGSRWYLWFAGLAVVSLAAGALFWRRLHRRKFATRQV